MKIFVVIIAQNKSVSKSAYELLGEAKRLVKDTQSKVCAVVLGHELKNLTKDLSAYGADQIYLCDHKELNDYSTLKSTAIIHQLIKQHSPLVVMFTADAIGRDLAPRLSARLNTGLTADCTRLELKDDGLYMTRPAFGGNLFATIICPNHTPQMCTVREGVFKPIQPNYNNEAQIFNINPTIVSEPIKIISQTQIEQSDQKIEQAKILVSVGRGCPKIQNAEELAKAIGGTISCSRAVVDLGKLPHECQVGQTGKTVRPACYFALGISGAVQHLAGMEESEYIIAINKDKDAPIFSVANLAIVANTDTLLPMLTKKINTLKGE